MTQTRTGAPSSRRTARHHAREMQRDRDRKAQRKPWIITAVIAVAVAAALVGFLIYASKGQPGRVVSIQGREHIEKGAQHVTYNSKPATSGPHWNLGGEAPVPWGIYEEPKPDEGLIHNLEHGGVGIHYNCRDCPDLVAQIQDFYKKTAETNKLPLFPNSTKLVVAPYYDMSNRIALTAWGRIDAFDQWDEERVVRFVDAFRNKGPEATP